MMTDTEAHQRLRAALETLSRRALDNTLQRVAVIESALLELIFEDVATARAAERRAIDLLASLRGSFQAYPGHGGVADF